MQVLAAPTKADIVCEPVAIRPRPGDTLYGIVTRPADRPWCSRVIVMCGKSAPGDLFRWFAQALAADGFLVLRFDPPGTEDSPGGDLDLDIPVEDFHRLIQGGTFTRSTRDAVLWAKNVFEPSELYLLGFCGTCASMLTTAAAEPDAVSGLMLVTPAVLYSGREGVARRYDVDTTSHMYFQRLFHPSAYFRFVSGRSDYRILWTLLRAWTARARRFASHAILHRTRQHIVRPTHPGFNEQFWDGFQTAMAHRKRVLFVLAELDRETADFNAEFREPVIQNVPDYGRLCSIVSLPKTDHSFLFPQGRSLALAALQQWLATAPAPALRADYRPAAPKRL
jgi:pimeloyl-ACP methyl ester carboxylesterase